MDLDGETCCGNGCKNCVLDTKLIKDKRTNRKINVLNSDYRNFVVKDILWIQCDIYELTFKLVDCDEDLEDKDLFVPPTGYLMMRALKNFEPSKINEVFKDFQDLRKKFVKNWNQKRLEKHDKDTEDKFISRPYTPFQIDGESLEFKILVKLEPGGKMSDYIQTLEIGSLVEIKGPFASFSYSRNSYKNLVIFTQGTCVTSSIILIQEILADDFEETRITLISCFKNLENVLFRDEVAEFSSYWNFKSLIFLSRENCSCENRKICDCLNSKLRHKERIFNHRMNLEEISLILENKQVDSTYFLLCGREDFQGFLKTCLAKLNFKNYSVL